MSSCFIELPKLGERYRNLYHNPNIVAPLKYKGEAGKGREIKDRISEADSEIRRIFENCLGFDRRLTALLTLHSNSYSLPASNHFIPLVNHTFGECHDVII